MARRLRRNWKDNTKMDFREVDFENHRWKEVLDCVQWLAVLLLVMNVKVLCCFNWILLLASFLV